MKMTTKSSMACASYTHNPVCFVYIPLVSGRFGVDSWIYIILYMPGGVHCSVSCIYTKTFSIPDSQVFIEQECGCL